MSVKFRRICESGISALLLKAHCTRCSTRSESVIQTHKLGYITSMFWIKRWKSFLELTCCLLFGDLEMVDGYPKVIWSLFEKSLYVLFANDLLLFSSLLPNLKTEVKKIAKLFLNRLYYLMFINIFCYR